MVATLTAPGRAKATADESVDHLYCCDENVSICGMDISEIPELDVLPHLCVVCAELEEMPCECEAK